MADEGWDSDDAPVKAVDVIGVNPKQRSHRLSCSENGVVMKLTLATYHCGIILLSKINTQSICHTVVVAMQQSGFARPNVR